MSKTVMMKFGPLEFKAGGLGYESLTREITRRIESVPSVGGSRLDGDEHADETLSVEGVVLMSSESLHSTLSAVTGTHELISENGKIFGRYAIKNFSLTNSKFFPDGTPKFQKFTLRLLRNSA